jgi:branched-subunit amino acid aminotransferase/4-amino-4-deoxychorismate lyase
MRLAERRGYKVAVRDDLLPIDLVGPNKECFMTGTGAGVMPITAIEDAMVGEGTPGSVTLGLVDDLERMMSDPAWGLSLDVPDSLVADVLANGVPSKAGR